MQKGWMIYLFFLHPAELIRGAKPPPKGHTNMKALALCIIMLCIAVTVRYQRIAVDEEQLSSTIYKNVALDSASKMFTVIDDLQTRNVPTSTEEAGNVIIWIHNVEDSLRHPNLNYRITTKQVVARRIAEREKDGIATEKDWLDVLNQSVEVAREHNKLQGLPKLNLGWLTAFRRLQQVLEAEACWQCIIDSPDDDSLSTQISLLDRVEAVRLQYTEEGHNLGSIAWVEAVLGRRVDLMKFVPTEKEIEAKRLELTNKIKAIRKVTPTPTEVKKPKPKKGKGGTPTEKKRPELSRPYDPEFLANA